ncbi:MAG: hypothetical protein H7Y11_08375 [Armatimonadetes bacterium]|nr:hypothetical protein [Anaerolineae bacterium]
MNDELSGQLASRTWQIPAYAQTSLWIETDAGVCRAEGARGDFTLPAPAEWVTVRWGHEAGPALAHLRWQPDALHWDGVIRVGGAIEALHLMGLPVMETNLVVMHVVGKPQEPGVTAFPAAQVRATDRYHAPDFIDALPSGLDETTTTWLIAEDSPLMSMTENAFLNGLRLWVSGQLAPDNSGWEALFALPLLLETVTLFAR